MTSSVRFLLYTSFAIALLAVSACHKDTSSSAAQAEGQRGQRGRGGKGELLAVKAVPVERISIQRQVDLSGTLASLDQVRVSGEVAGVVASVNADLGQEVRAGEILVQLDTRELEFSVARAESALHQTE